MIHRWPFLSLLFAGSGVPALIYQVVWQRSLFTLFGTDSVAVAVVVSAFMLGLGAGSLLGGEISRRPRAPLLKVFAALEIGMACFALVSLPLFERVGAHAAVSPLGLFGLSFLLLLVPTLMMGMTLPLLVTFLVRHSGLVGRSVGTLYAANTLGSAAACFLVAYGLMPYLGKQQSLQVAAAINGAVGLLVLLLDGWERAKRDTPLPGTRSDAPRQAHLPVALGMLATAISGFLSLGFEVAWYRLFAFSTGGRAETLPVLLGYFLLGTATGSVLAGWTGHRLRGRSRTGLAIILAAACVSAVLVAPLLLVMTPHVSGMLRQAPLVVLPAALFGMVLPIACDFAVPANSQVGRRLGFLYAANIAGSTLGALAVGLLFMDVMSLRLVLVVLMAIGLASAAVLGGRSVVANPGLATIVLVAGLATSVAILSGSFYERLRPRFVANLPEGRFDEVIENQSGVITVDPDGIVYGGGVYDGRFNIDLLDDTSGIFRPFALSAVHPAPKQVLMIGLASGSWAQVVAHNPTVERLVVVEINPGYLELVRRHAVVESLLRNPRVEIVEGDGRQWLKAHPAAKFDAIVMNTTFSWRNNATNVLSREFLQLVASHLSAGGVAMLNPTGSAEVAATALSVFPHALDVGGMLVLGDEPLAFDRPRWLARQAEYRIDGRPVVDRADPGQVARLEEIVANVPVRDEAAVRQWAAGRTVITDDNLCVEWTRRELRT